MIEDPNECVNGVYNKGVQRVFSFVKLVVLKIFDVKNNYKPNYLIVSENDFINNSLFLSFLFLHMA